MTAIVCVDKNWAIGRENRLLFRISADLKHFRGAGCCTSCSRRGIAAPLAYKQPTGLFA